MSDKIHAPSEQADINAGWSSRLAFILAAAGSAVGLGNVWKFPYITGENGGGAFVLVYLVCISIIGLPILAAEIMLGRRGKANPVQVFVKLGEEEKISTAWQGIGWMGLLCSFFILSFYSVVAGWALVYLWHSLTGQFALHEGDVTGLAERIGGLFDSLLANPALLLLGHTLVMIATAYIVARGIRGGVEKAVRIMVPGLLLIIIGLVIYAAVSTGEFGTALAFMFNPDFSSLTWTGVLVALGHAFFTLSVGMCAMMAYGSFLDRSVNIGKAAFAIAGLDTLIALMAGLAIFPIVFAHDLMPGEGPGLVFVTLPIAFTEVPGGTFVSIFFFLFLAMAALTSSISMLEPLVEYMEYRCNWSRPRTALVTGVIIWILGIGCALAFNLWSGFTPFGKNLFDLFDWFTQSLLLPLGGMLIAIYAGWILSRRAIADEMEGGTALTFSVWIVLLRFVAPLAIALVLINTLFPGLFS
jgi:NSS family neurotransmitter:Na+ symporter